MLKTIFIPYAMYVQINEMITTALLNAAQAPPSNTTYAYKENVYFTVTVKQKLG